MKIALINPPSPFLIDERVFPNLGMIRVATNLVNNGIDVEVYDLAGDKNYLDTTRHLPNADAYGFSSTSPQFPVVYQMNRVLKESSPNAYTILGGSHATAISMLREKGIPDLNINSLEEFDTIFSGEGDDTRNMLLSGWQKGSVIKNLDNLPLLDRSFLDISSYHYYLNGADTTSIQTQRGCSGKCTFCCGRDLEMYNRVRTLSPERVLAELDQLHEDYGYKSFMWYDDEINLNQKRLEELCLELSKRPYQHRGFVRSDMIIKSPESVRQMKKAGFVKLCAGVESGSDRILELIEKGITVEQNTEARKIIGDNGIHYEAFLLLGHPSETLDDIQATRNWIADNKPDDYDICLVSSYPGSKQYDEAIPSEKFENYGWEYNGVYFNKPDFSKQETFYKGKDGLSFSNIRTDEVSNWLFNKQRDWIGNLK